MPGGSRELRGNEAWRVFNTFGRGRGRCKQFRDFSSKRAHLWLLILKLRRPGNSDGNLSEIAPTSDLQARRGTLIESALLFQLVHGFAAVFRRRHMRSR